GRSTWHAWEPGWLSSGCSIICPAVLGAGPAPRCSWRVVTWQPTLRTRLAHDEPGTHLHWWPGAVRQNLPAADAISTFANRHHPAHESVAPLLCALWRSGP